MLQLHMPIQQQARLEALLTWVLQISAVAASSMRLSRGTHPNPPSQASRYCIPTLTLLRSVETVLGPLGTCKRIQAVLHYLGLLRKRWHSMLSLH